MKKLIIPILKIILLLEAIAVSIALVINDILEKPNLDAIMIITHAIVYLGFAILAAIAFVVVLNYTEDEL